MSVFDTKKNISSLMLKDAAKSSTTTADQLTQALVSSTTQKVGDVTAQPAKKKDDEPNEAMTGILTREHAAFDEREQMYQDMYGDHWKIAKGKELGVEPSSLDSVRDGWKDTKPEQREKILDKIAKTAAKRRKALREHDYIMKLASGVTGGAATNEAAGALAYKNKYDAMIAAGKRRSAARSAAKDAMEKSKQLGSSKKTNKGLFGSISSKVKQSEEMDEIRREALQEGIDNLQGDTPKALKEDLKKKREATKVTKEQTQADILTAEKEHLRKMYGDRNFTVSMKAAMEAKGNPDISKLSYKDHRAIIHEAASMAMKNKLVFDQHERWMKVPAYSRLFEAEAGGMNEMETAALVLSQHEEFKQVAMREDKQFHNRSELKQVMEKISKEKNMKPKDREEAIHKELDKLEEKAGARYTGDFVISYQAVGREDANTKEQYTPAQRKKLIDQQIYLMEKNRNFVLASAEYEQEIKTQNTRNQQYEALAEANPRDAASYTAKIKTPAQMIKHSTAVARGGNSAKNKESDKRILRNHQMTFQTAKAEKYTEKYGHYFTRAWEDALEELGENPDMKARYEALEKARKQAAEAQSIGVIGTQGGIGVEAYRKAYDAKRGTKGQKRHAGRVGKHHAEMMQDENYKTMFTALNTRTTKESTAQRRAQKHAKRMRDNEAYRQGYQTYAAKVGGPMSQKDIQKAREAGRQSAKRAQVTQDDKKAQTKYEEVYDQSRKAYDQKYIESAKKGREHAKKRAKRVTTAEGDEKLVKGEGGNAKYRQTYEAAMQAGKTPSEALKAVKKQIAKEQKAEAKMTEFQGRVNKKADDADLQELPDKFDFYKIKYPGDPKKAYKHAVAAAKAIREAREAASEDIEIYDHPQFISAFADAYEETGDEKKALAMAQVRCADLRKKSLERKHKGQFIAEGSSGLNVRGAEQLTKMADSGFVKLVEKIKDISSKGEADTSPGFLDSIVAKILRKGRTQVDTPKPEDKKEGGGGPSLSTVTGTMDKVMPAVNTGLSAKTLADKVNEVKEGIDPVTKLTNSFDVTKLSGLFGPVIAAATTIKEIVGFIIDTKKGVTTEDSLVQLMKKLGGVVPNVMNGANTIRKAFPVQSLSALTDISIVGNVASLLSGINNLAGHSISLLSAMQGAQNIRKNLEESKQGLIEGRHRDVLRIDKSHVGASSKVKVRGKDARAAMHEARANQQPTEDDKGRLEALTRWNRDYEYKRLFKKLIRERSLDISQDVVGLAAAIAGFFPEGGQIAAAALNLAKTGASAVRVGVRQGKDMAREHFSSNPMRRGAKFVDLDRSKANKLRDRAVFAQMLFDDIAALPLPKDMPEEPEQQGTWLKQTTNRYLYLQNYTTNVIDLRNLLKAESKAGILELLIGSMAARSHS